MPSPHERGPLDDFESDESHRKFREYLEEERRLTPKLREDMPTVQARRVLDKTAETPVDTGPYDNVPVIKEEDTGLVTILMGARHDVRASYTVSNPAEVRVLASDGVPGAVIEATRVLLRTSVRLRGLPPAEPQRKIAGLARADAAARLLELGRP